MGQKLSGLGLETVTLENGKQFNLDLLPSNVQDDVKAILEDAGATVHELRVKNIEVSGVTDVDSEVGTPEEEAIL